MDPQMHPGTEIGSYRIDYLLGQGGMAEVYKAWNTGLHRYEALKLLPPQMTYDRSFVERFLNEARMAAGLHHSHIATIHTVSQPSEEQPYFTMELVEGGDLANHILHLGSFSIGEALPILCQVSEALDYAHAHGIIHRDVKPANILLQQTGQGGWHVKMVDFGIARAQEPGNGARLTKTGMIVGTPEYMSPEQGGSGARVDHRTDVYSLGVIAYEMLCGHPPFASGMDGSAISVIMSHIRDLPRPPIEQLPKIPLVVNDAILRALAKDPESRFKSCGDFVIALTGAVASNRVGVPAASALNASVKPQLSPSRPPMLWNVFALTAVVILGGSMIAISVLKERPPEKLISATTNTLPAPMTVQVPKFVGKTEDQARSLASQASLDVNVATDHSTGVPAGSVISQSIAPGIQAQSASQINLLVSTGPSSSVTAASSAPVTLTHSVSPSSNSESHRLATGGNSSTESSAQTASELRGRYDQWLQAWRRMDLSTYMSFYSPSIIERRSGKPSYGFSEMRQKLTENWAKQSYITVDSGLPDMQLRGDMAIVSVLQHYDSTTWWDQGLKKMIWARENGTWLIREESFSKQAGGSKR